MRLLPLAATFAAVALVFSDAGAVQPRPIQHSVTGDLTLDQAIKLALKQNPNVLKALWQIENTRGQIIEVRAEALPHVALTSSYFQQSKTLLQGRGSNGSSGLSGTSSSSSSNSTSDLAKQLSGIPGLTQSAAEQVVSAVQNSQSQSSQAQTSTGGGDISWNVEVQVSQVLYAGGQVRAAINIARFTDDSSYFNLRDVIDQTIDTVRQQFYTVLLNRELITVQEESVRLLADQLKDQQNRFEAGTVPRFNVLQAEVALANQQPQLISARNNYLISEYQLAKTLGIDPGPQGQTTYHAVGKLQVNERPLGLRNAIQMGIEHRPFLKVQRLTILIQKEQVKVALAGYKPQLNANGGYEVRNSSLTSHLDDTIDGWFFGINGQWNIFDGLETYGKVKAARASLESAKVNYDDSVHQVELEVQQAYANVQTARETIRSQQKTVEQALEAVRLATERLAAGAGTQLDVLNAQVQLTTARSTELQARANYNTALAEFDRVTATATSYAETFNDPLLVRRKVPKDPVFVDTGDVHDKPLPTPRETPRKKSK
ncbi:MAG: TolC family protein [Chthoniobacter sp.]|uniref:TolC family protein n=1 Tax=Chthoniobacter sp. TaxID=2510640 RepID=UPI0032A2D904